MRTTEYHVMITWVRKNGCEPNEMVFRALPVKVAGATEAEILNKVLTYFRETEGIGNGDDATVIFYRAVPNQLPAPTGTELC